MTKVSPIKAFINYSIIFVCTLSAFLITGCKAYYSYFYADPTKGFELAEKIKPYDAVIIPGYPYFPNQKNGIIEERIKWAAYLYKNGYTRNVIMSGAAVHSPYVEAEVMRLLALQAGIDDAHILLEPKAEHASENVYYSSQLAEQKGLTNVAFATQPSQASFVKVFVRKFKLKVEMLPIVTDSLNKHPLSFKPIDVSKLFIPDFVPLDQRISKLKSLMGTRGHKIKLERRKERKQKRKSK